MTGSGTTPALGFNALPDPDRSADELPPADPPLRLLIVDDSAPVGRALARIARGFGWVVDTVTSWSEGQVRLRWTRYHCFLVDYGLGGDVTGLEAINWARRAYCTMPVALMSGDDGAAAAAAAVGCPVLIKPFSRDAFAALLDSAARSAARFAKGDRKETRR